MRPEVGLSLLKSSAVTMGLIAVVGCSKGAEYLKLDFEIVAAEKPTKEPRVPAVLWDEWTKPTPETLEYSKVKAYLIEETSGTLGKKNYQVQFPEGGGDLDLGNFVKSEKSGLWSMAIDVDHADEKEAKLQVFYVSGARRRKLSGQVFGTGCGRVLEITTHFKKSMKHKGFEVSSAAARDLSLMGGTFYFVVKKEKKVWLSRLTVADRYREKYLCRETSS